MAVRYTMHIWSGRKLIPYKGKGYGWPDRSFTDINSIRKFACTLLPRDSTTRRITIYCDGTDSGVLIRRGGRFIWIPGHPEYERNIIYVINPDTGRTVPGSKRVMKDYTNYAFAKTGTHFGIM